MKITHAHIQNFQILTHIDLPMDTPITLLAADMEQGKSSFGEALRMALTGEATRVSAKKDYKELIRDSQKNGSVIVTWDDAISNRLARTTLTLPAGTGTDRPTGKAADLLPLLLNPQRIAEQTPDALREILYNLIGGRPDAQAVTDMLIKRGYHAAKAAEVGPSIVSAYAAGHKYASERISECRAVWKGITGETYGAVKAPIWEAARPPYDAAEITRLESALNEIDDQLTLANNAAGTRRAALNQQEESEKARTRWTAIINQQPGRETALQLATAALAEINAQVSAAEQANDLIAGTKRADDYLNQLALFAKAMLNRQPSPINLIDHLPARSALDQYIAHHGEPVSETLITDDQRALAARLGEFREEREIWQRRIKRAQHELAECAAAVAVLAELPAPADDAELGLFEAEAEAAAINSQRLDLAEQLAAQIKDREANHQADSLTANARTAHVDVTEWLAIADALAPTGIPSEEAGKHVKPLNARLRHTALITGWDQVAVDGDATIRIANRGYRMCSESARWRADAALVEALAHLSGLRLFMLDRVDVLSLAGRSVLMNWLISLATAGEIDTALLMGTFKSPPAGLPEAVAVHWLEQGALAEAA